MRTLFLALGVASSALVVGQLAFADEPVYRVGDGVTAPRVIKTVEVTRYPEEARKAGVQGTVVLQVEISEEGRVENVHVSRSLRPDLDEKAIAAVQECKFEPAKKNGKPVRVSVKTEVSFHLQPSYAGDPTYEMGEGVTAPKLMKKVEPKYTEEARTAGVEGAVTLRAAINLEGRPEEIVVFKGLHPDLDKNAIAAFQQWEFEPGKKDGKPVRVLMTIEMSFKSKP